MPADVSAETSAGEAPGEPVEWEVGCTLDAGYQIGVRRTLPVSEARLWALLRSPEGQRLWLGGVTDLEPGTRFSFPEGTQGEIRVHRPWSHLRLTWQPPAWEAPSFVQLRVLPARSGATTLSFHQDHLRGPAERAEMQARWEAVAGSLAALR
jgi:uncharacterized protein YndB with AHSA1/START domain